MYSKAIACITQAPHNLNPRYVGLLRMYCLNSKRSLEQTIHSSIDNHFSGWQ